MTGVHFKIKTSEIILASLSGGVTALAFPKFSFFLFAWISLLPLVFIIYKKKPGQAFLLGWVAGFFFYAILLYWIPNVPAHYGNLSLGASIGIYVVFTLFLGLFWAFFSSLSAKIRWAFPKAVFLIMPLLWVAFEYMISYFLTGFPWGLLGYSQYKNLYFIQLSAISGIYSLSMILILFQCLVVYSVKYKTKGPIIFGLALVFVIHLGGHFNIKPVLPQENSFQAAAIQGNVPAETDFTELTFQEIADIFGQHLGLSDRAHKQGARLVVWAELSVPLCFSCNDSFLTALKNQLFQFARQKHTTFLLGTNEIKRERLKTAYYNTATCLQPDLSFKFYHKMHLVPFGEYTPYKPIFSFVSKFTHAIGELTPGSEMRLHDFAGIEFGSPICYEIIFPQQVRQFVKKGAKFLVTITNDGWYGSSSAPYQHFAIAVLRAVENRRFLLRAATTGISGIIDPYGRVLEQSQLDSKTYLSSQITPLYSITLYTRLGDLLPLASLTLSALFLILAWMRRKNE